MYSIGSLQGQQMTSSILLSGVGGQGILLAAKIIGEAAELSGFEVCSNEIHGMAQRGGSVTAQVRFGKKVFKGDLFVDVFFDRLFGVSCQPSNDLM